MIRVLLVEDQHLFRKGVQALINEEADMEVVGTVSDGNEALNQITTLLPDVIFIDIHIPSIDGILATAKIKTSFPYVKIVYVTASLENELVINAIDAGADCLLVKELYPDYLIQAIRDVYHGQIVLSGEVAKIIVEVIRELTNDTIDILARQLENKGIYLTKRELEIATLLLEKKSNIQIAQSLHLTEGTVKNYISNIYLKFNVHNRKRIIAILEDITKIS